MSRSARQSPREVNSIIQTAPTRAIATKLSKSYNILTGTALIYMKVMALHNRKWNYNGTNTKGAGRIQTVRTTDSKD